MQLAANLSLLWTELPFLNRFDAAAEAGFEAVEVLFPYDAPAKVIQQALNRNNLKLVLMNAPPPNYTGGPRGFAAISGGQQRFQHDMRRTFRYTDLLRVPMLHIMAGEANGAEARDTFVENLRYVSRAAPKGLTLTIEPLNPQSMPGYFLNDYDLAADILREVGAENLGLQYDSFHAQMIHGDAVEVFEKYRDQICHVQLGDTPERGAPGTGDVDFKSLFKAIETSGYDGYVSGEYHPGGKTEETLAWTRVA